MPDQAAIEDGGSEIGDLKPPTSTGSLAERSRRASGYGHTSSDTKMTPSGTACRQGIADHGEPAATMNDGTTK
jgi:hypothetical protein